jgi:mRNA interferase MazF
VVIPTPLQGEIWWAEAMDKRRPVLVVTRSQAVPVLTWVLVAPVTRTVRGIPTEISLGPDQGLTEPCVASFDNVQPIRKSFLTSRLGALTDSRRAICTAMAAMADC